MTPVSSTVGTLPHGQYQIAIGALVLDGRFV